MQSLEHRVAKLEAKAYTANIAKLSDSELDAYILTLEDGAPQWWDAILARVARHPSTLPIVHDDPAHKNANDDPDW